MESILSCDYGIKFALNYKECESCGSPGKIKIILENEENWNTVSDEICKKLYGEERNCRQEEINETFRKFNYTGYCLCEEPNDDLGIKPPRIYLRNNLIDFYGGEQQLYEIYR